MWRVADPDAHCSRVESPAMGDEAVAHGIPTGDFRGIVDLRSSARDVAANADSPGAELSQFAIVEQALASARAEVDTVAPGQREVAMLELNVTREAESNRGGNIRFRLGI